jgi:hypothetical protein
MTRRRFKSGSSYGQDSAALDCPTFLLSGILQLAWRLVCLRNVARKHVAKKLKVTETTT